MVDTYLEKDAWRIIEREWNPAKQTKSESIFSIGNGRMGQRANFEEDYSGDTFQGSYVAGVYYPDKTRVGWWKNGYPEYFAKVLNAVNWIGLRLSIEGHALDLDKVEIEDFYRELNMQQGTLIRSFKAKFEDGKQIAVHATRFLSIVKDEIGAIRYQITPLNFSGSLHATPYLDFDVVNEDSHYDEKFWEEVEKSASNGKGHVIARTRKLDFVVAAAMRFDVAAGDERISLIAKFREDNSYVENSFNVDLEQGKTYSIYKYAAVVSNLNYAADELASEANNKASDAQELGFDELLKEHVAAWARKWELSDIEIDGDISAQQGIRFNIFHLNQTFTGVDERLNIGPKGFTGEKYGGSTYWDTEAYCLPFYLATAEQNVARNLLLYRYKQLHKAIENAEKLGFKNGAALYPMVTMNGEECHNEWEITFEEIHRNAAIAYGIFNYVRHTQDVQYLADYGLEVLIAISRFWAQRVHWSDAKNQYVMLGVTGPNEYENNINNNWYTSRMACWTMEFTTEAIDIAKELDGKKVAALLLQIGFDQKAEMNHWKHIIANMHYPFDAKRNVHLQQEGFLDKELIPAHQLDLAERPINQHWSWDRILRSVYIKQADVLQGMYFLMHHYDNATIRRNFDFYEPFTVHESSLSPCVHAVLAAKIGYGEKAYELYLRTSRLDLDDYNKEVHEGLHITSMAGTWLSVVQGFGGMQIIKSNLHFEPRLPKHWKSLKFNLYWRGTKLSATISGGELTIENRGQVEAEFYVSGHLYRVDAGAKENIKLDD